MGFTKIDLGSTAKLRSLGYSCTTENLSRVVEWGSTARYRVAEVLGGLMYNNKPLFNDPR